MSAKPQPWFRFYTSVPDDPKVWRLSDALYRLWTTCLCLAGRNDGILPARDDIAFHARKPRKMIEGQISELITTGFLEETDKGLTPHGWSKRQYASDRETSADRVKRFRDQRKKQRVTDGVTDDETLQVTHTKHFPSVSVSVSGSEVVNSKKETKPIPRASDFAIFWARWCELTGRKQRESDACRAWLSVAESDQSQAIMLCLERYGESGEVARGAITNPDKWLFEQARDHWQGDWPRLKSAAEIRSEALSRAVGDD